VFGEVGGGFCLIPLKDHARNLFAPI